MNRRNDFSGTKRTGKARVGFWIHLTAYLVVNALLVYINLTNSPDQLWVQWPLLGWGIGILAHALAVFALPIFRGVKR